MDMQAVENAMKFWDVVEACLVRLFGFDHATAASIVVRRQGKMKEAAIHQDVVYHVEPLYVASDLAGVDMIAPALEVKYDALLREFAYGAYAAEQTREEAVDVVISRQPKTMATIASKIRAA